MKQIELSKFICYQDSSFWLKNKYNMWTQRNIDNELYYSDVMFYSILFYIIPSFKKWNKSKLFHELWRTCVTIIEDFIVNHIEILFDNIFTFKLILILFMIYYIIVIQLYKLFKRFSINQFFSLNMKNSLLCEGLQ